MIDLVLVSIPYILPTLPPAAPAALKGHLESCGFKVTTRDFNIKILQKIKNHPLGEILPEYWMNGNTIDNIDYRNSYEQIVTDLAKELIDLDSKWIGISVFSDHSRRFAQDLLQSLHVQKKSDVKILIGGRGIEQGFTDIVRDYIDCYIMGDGELPLENLLKGNYHYPGINSAGTQISDMNILVTPDYSDYQYLHQYEHYYDSPAIQLTSSRGCIRRCSFCNVPSLWPDYQVRSGDLVANDIINLYETTGVKHFFFTDSLINGNIKQLTKMMSLLADYRSRTGADITWGGQWISRRQKGLPIDYYQLIKASGGDNITIGVETGSDAVRAHMKKGFTNEDLDAEMEQFSRHGIRCGFFMMVGYVTETRDDFFQTLEMFKRYTRYVADGTLIGFVIGAGFHALPDAPIFQEKDKIFRIEKDSVKWHSLVANVDWLESLHRRIVAQQVTMQLRWPANAVHWELSPLLLKLQDNKTHDQIKKWPDIDIEGLLSKYQLADHPEPMEIKVEMTGTRCVDWPRIDIIINNVVVFKDIEISGEMCLRFAVPTLRKKNVLKFRMKNKGNSHTRIDGDAKILEDMNVKLNSICFGQIRKRTDDLFLQSSFKDFSRNLTQQSGLYVNGDLRFYFENPTIKYFMDRKLPGFNERDENLNREVLTRLIKFYKSL